MAIVFWVLPSCSAKPGDAVTPSIVGVVDRIETREGADPLYHLEDGTIFDPTDAESLRGGAPFEGELLLADASDDDRWYYPLSMEDFGPACPFVISDGDAWEESEAIVFEVGIRLLKAEDYLRPEPIEDVYYDHSLFCVNREGEVTGVPEDLDGD